MTYDSVRSRVVLFGGVDAGNVSYDDTWEYDGVSWAQGPGAPVNLTARSGHKMVYDTSLQRIVLFG
ncbi:MAG: kelch repeat-containing protein, partial [Acidobacteriota bacterium]